jgi:hypothetical protein
MKPHIQWAHLILLAALIGACTSSHPPAEPYLSPSAQPATEIVTMEDASTSLPPLSVLPMTPGDIPNDTPTSDTETSAQAMATIGTETDIPAVKTATLTPTPATPIATIQILAPGPASRVISPVHVSAYLKPGARGNIRVDLLGEDGRLLGRKILVYAPNLSVHMLADMEFEIPGAAEAGRLVISTEDPQGRTIALASVDILLMSMGEADINPPGDLLEDIIIQEPTNNTFIQGGEVIVTGKTRLHSNEPLLVEMIATDGKHIGPIRLVNVPGSTIGGYSPFTAEVPYSVSSPTWVRLIVYENPGRIPGTSHLSSVEILLGQ